jgi:aspartyl-tRNA(Asn)/glutamyl-tRNA(Gln) amidotransferase subunit B
MKEYGLSVADASVLIAERNRADYFETAVKGGDAKLTANWILSELLGALNKAEKDLDHSPVSAEQLGGLIALVTSNAISGRQAKEVFAEMFATSKDAKTIVAEKGLTQVTDTGAIEKIINEVLAANPDKITEYQSGKDKLFGFFVGQVLKLSGGQANPAIVNDLLKSKLEKKG